MMLYFKIQVLISSINLNYFVALEDILTDRTHGSTYLVTQYLILIRDGNFSKEEIQDMNTQMRAMYPDMAVIAEITDILDFTENPEITSASIIEDLENTTSRLREKITDYISSNSHILTFSNSQTVINVLGLPSFDSIYCMESIPGGEGRAMAEAIGGQMITDDKGYSMLPDIDTIILGCDRYDDTSFVNKIGTAELCSKANQFNCKIIVLTSKYKQVNQIKDVKTKLLEKISLEGVTLLAA